MSPETTEQMIKNNAVRALKVTKGNTMLKTFMYEKNDCILSKKVGLCVALAVSCSKPTVAWSVKHFYWNGTGHGNQKLHR